MNVASDGQEALEKIASLKPDLIILDILMSRIDGREVLRRLRQDGNWTAIILLTQVGESTERAMALEEGADDYLNKPFDPHELVARIRSVLRRARPGQPPLAAAARLACGELTLDRASRRVRLAGRELMLTPKSVMLLEYLMTHPDELVSRERLLDIVWGWDYPVGRARSILASQNCAGHWRRMRPIPATLKPFQARAIALWERWKHNHESSGGGSSCWRPVLWECSRPGICFNPMIR